MPRNARTIIELRGTRLRVRHSSDASRDASAWIPGDSQANWDSGLRTIDEHLEAALASAGVAPGASVDVVYSSDTATITAGPAPGKPAQAVQTVLLELEQHSGADLSIQPHGATVIGSGTAAHCVAVTDPASTLDTLYRWCERAGVRMRRAIPAESVGLVGALREHLSKPAHGAALSLWIGDGASGVVLSGESGIRFVRSSSLTGDALRRALTAANSRAQAERRLTAEEADSVLMTVGVPDPDAEASVPGFSNTELRAAMQPLVQRACVDLRQSLRFGLTAEEQRSVELTLCGPASRIPGLAGFIGGVLGVAVTQQGTPSDTPLACEVLDSIGLEPSNSAGSGTDSRTAKALWAGAAAGLALSVGQFFWHSAAAEQATEASAQLAASAEQVENDKASEAALQREMLTQRRLDAAIAQHTGFGPRWPGWFVDLAQRTPTGVVLLGMNALREQGDAGAITLTGVVTPGEIEGANENERLRRFLEGLADSPLVASVELGTTRRGTVLGEGSTSFQLTVMLSAAPTTHTLAEATSDD